MGAFIRKPRSEENSETRVFSHQIWWRMDSHEEIYHPHPSLSFLTSFSLMASFVSWHLYCSFFIYLSTSASSTKWLTFFLYIWFDLSPKAKKINPLSWVNQRQLDEILFILDHLLGGMVSLEILSPVAVDQPDVLGCGEGMYILYNKAIYMQGIP